MWRVSTAKRLRERFLPVSEQDDTDQREAQVLLQRYRAGQVPPQEHHSMLIKWYKAYLTDAIPDIIPFLENPDASIRSIALKSLLIYFRREEYWQVAIDFFLYDVNFIVRREAAQTLGWFKEGTKNQPTLAVLASVVNDPYDEDDPREYAYWAMHTIVSGAKKSIEIEETFNKQHDYEFLLDQDANWTFVRSWIDPSHEQALQAEAKNLLQDYRAGKVAPKDYYSLLLKWGRAHVSEAQPEIEVFLTNSNPRLRAIALADLVLYLQVPSNWQRTVDILTNSANNEDRIAAAQVLGRLKRGTRDKETLQILDQFQPPEVDDSISYACFEAILRVFPEPIENLAAFLQNS